MVIECGTQATTKIGNLSGMITAAIIRFDSVRYEFSYMKDGELIPIWVDEKELNIGSDKISIGFKNA